MSSARTIRIAVIGTGYVGLVSGACFASVGIQTTCVDLDELKIERLRGGISPIHEPGLDQLLAKVIRDGTISFTSNLAAAVEDADAVFIAVGTPTDATTGKADLRYVLRAARDVAPLLREGAYVVVKSTVPPGTNARVAAEIRNTAPNAIFHSVSNPEFLREGQAIQDFLKPDRVVVGVENPAAEQFMRELYRPFRCPVHVVGIVSAEIAKYAANAFLATKIAFIGEIADLCEKAGGDVRDVATGMGMDPRIAPAFLKPGPGFGGSCFPKDTLALVQAGIEFDTPQTIVSAVVSANDARNAGLAQKISTAIGGLKDARVGILGVAFKPGTDDLRDSPALDLIPSLLVAGAKVLFHDPEATDHSAFAGAKRCVDPMEVARDADVIILLTDWPLYLDLDMRRLRDLMAGPTVIDLRNAWDGVELQKLGFSYLGVGLGTDRPVATRHH